MCSTHQGDIQALLCGKAGRFRITQGHAQLQLDGCLLACGVAQHPRTHAPGLRREDQDAGMLAQLGRGAWFAVRLQVGGRRQLARYHAGR